MRAVGLALVILGFLWLADDQFSIGPIGRAVMDSQLKGIPADTTLTLTAGEISSIVGNTVGGMYEGLPNVLWPGAMMLLGGLVLFRAGRRPRTPTVKT